MKAPAKKKKEATVDVLVEAEQRLQFRRVVKMPKSVWESYQRAEEAWERGEDPKVTDELGHGWPIDIFIKRFAHEAIDFDDPDEGADLEHCEITLHKLRRPRKKQVVR